MTAFYKVVNNDGFITGFGTNGNDSAIALTEAEYDALVAFFRTRPTAQAGFAYILRDNPREWVLVEAPIVEEEATLEDFENALADLGVRV